MSTLVDHGQQVRRAGLCLCLAAAISLAWPGAGGATEEGVVTLVRTTTVVAEGPAAVLVDVPHTLDAREGDLPQQATNGDVVAVDGVENFVALVLTSVQQRAGESEAEYDLPRLVAAKLKVPGQEARILFTLQGRRDGAFAEELPAGRYRLSVLSTGPVAVTLALPGLAEGAVTVTATEPVRYHQQVSLHDPTPVGSHWPLFWAGFEHETTTTTEVFQYVWSSGDRKAARTMALCSDWGINPAHAMGLYPPGCINGDKAGFRAVDWQMDGYFRSMYGWWGTRAPGTYRVGGEYAIVGQPTGGGTMAIWLETPG